MELVFLAVLLFIVAVMLWFVAQNRRRATGLPIGHVIYTDTGAWQRNERPLFSSRHRLTGKPDYLVRHENAIIPVEVKSSTAPREPRDAHVLQLAAYCLLVEEVYKIRPDYGIIRYADKQFAVDYTAELQAALLNVIGKMRSESYTPTGAHRSHTDIHRCAGCGVRDACSERLS